MPVYEKRYILRLLLLIGAGLLAMILHNWEPFNYVNAWILLQILRTFEASQEGA